MDARREQTRPRDVVVLVCAAAVTLLAAELGSRRFVSGQPPESAPVSRRAPNVLALSKDPLVLPDPVSASPLVMLMGNSHTYGLPGLQQGAPLRPDPGDTLIDRLAGESLQLGVPSSVEFWRVSNPNLLPFEMLTRSEYLLSRGAKPNLVFVALCWPNIARGRDVRYDIHQVFGDDAFVQRLRGRLSAVAADDRIRDAVEAEVRQVQFERDKDRMRSIADTVDVKLTDAAGAHSTLLGRSADLRARAYRAVFSPLQERLTHGDSTTKDATSGDLEFNLATVKTLVNLLRNEGATVVAYFTPERTDLPPMVDSALEESTLAALRADLESEGARVVDARHVVPNEYWGWAGDTADRAHFTEPGHQRLGKFLAEAAEAASAWSAVRPAEAPR